MKFVLRLLGICAFSIVCFGQTHYTNLKYGISFTYPKSFDLKEGALEEGDWDMGTLGPIPMEFVASGGVRVVSVRTPIGAYPGTDLRTAFLTVSVNRSLTQKECEKFPDGVPGNGTPVTKAMSGILFHGMEQGGAAAGSQFGATYYHGFAAGWCYEIGEGVATGGYGAVDGMKRYNGANVSAIFQAILSTVVIRPVAARIKARPTIKAFALTPAAESSPTGDYQLSWEVEDAAKDEVWLSSSCPADLRILKMSDSGIESPFPCDSDQPIEVPNGSVDLRFRNNSGGDLQVTIRIFAAGSPPVSRSATVSVGPLPVLITLTGGGERYVRGDNAKSFPIRAGQRYQMTGVGLMGTETLWLGTTRIPISSQDSETILFTSPESIAPGVYPMFLSNERGKSDPLMVEILK